jgi:hypothetical protein
MTIAPTVGHKSDRAYAPTLRKAAATEAAGYSGFASPSSRTPTVPSRSSTGS